MDRHEFRLRVEAARSENPVWFGLEGDPPATKEEVLDAETALGVRFPEAYREFLEDYGGGYFALANVFSVKAESEWNVVERNRDAHFVGGGFLAVSDNGVGDYYGFQVVRGECQSPLMLWNHEEEGRISPTSFRNLYEFLARVGMRLG